MWDFSRRWVTNLQQVIYSPFGLVRLPEVLLCGSSKTTSLLYFPIKNGSKAVWRRNRLVQLLKKPVVKLRVPNILSISSRGHPRRLRSSALHSCSRRPLAASGRPQPAEGGRPCAAGCAPIHGWPDSLVPSQAAPTGHRWLHRRPLPARRAMRRGYALRLDCSTRHYWMIFWLFLLSMVFSLIQI